LFLAVKEALHNAVQHAQASEIRLHIAVADGRLTLGVSDDGRGFDPGRLPVGASGGNGLPNMRQRLVECGGACDIDTAPNRGTRITFSLPLPLPPQS
jgi:signal transduction histidine kinase